MFEYIDGPYIEELVSDGEMIIQKWSNGLYLGYFFVKDFYGSGVPSSYKKKGFKPPRKKWEKKDFASWPEAEKWYRDGIRC